MKKTHDETYNIAQGLNQGRQMRSAQARIYNNPSSMEVEMNFIVWIIFGALAGWIASIIMGRNKKMGAIANIVVGIVGAFIGGWVMNFFGAQGVTGFNLSSFVVAVIGAVVLLFVVGLFRR